MNHSSFEPDPAVHKNLAKAVDVDLRTAASSRRRLRVGHVAGRQHVLDGQRPGPVSRACCSPAAKAGRRHPQAETLEQMWTPQFAKPGEKTGFGIGFDSRGVGGPARSATAGPSTASPPSWRRCPTTSSAWWSSPRATSPTPSPSTSPTWPCGRCWRSSSKKPLPKIEETQPLGVGQARRAGGPLRRRGRQGHRADRAATATAVSPCRRPGRLAGGAAAWATAACWWIDSPLADGPKIERQGRQARHRQGHLRARRGREAEAGAGEVGRPDRRVRLGPQHAVHPREGRPAARPDRVVLPLSAGGGSRERLQVPRDFGLYHGEKLVFTRDKNGRATKVEAAGVVFERRTHRRRERRDVQDQAGAAGRGAAPRGRSGRQAAGGKGRLPQARTWWT